MTPPRKLPVALVAALAATCALVGGSTAAAGPLAVTVTSRPANPSHTTTATFAFAQSGGATTCSLDGSAYTACAGQIAYSGLRPGTHTFTVRTGAAAIYKVSSYSWTIDTSAPSTPSGVSAAGQSHQVALSWHAASDPDSSVAYSVSRNGTRIGQTSATSYVDTSVSAATTYQYAVTAYDPAGNLSPASATITAGTTGPQPLGVGGTWSLKFDDEFSAGTLDLTKWQPNWLGPNNTKVTPPDNSSDLNCMDPAQVTEGAGVLNLTAVARSCRADNGHTYPYASGLVNTHNHYQFAYGYAEARIYIPATGSGAPVNFPAFWANGTGTWPTTGELDVMEVLGACGPGLGYHFHSSAGSFGGCATLPVSTGWHTFGANWQSGVVTYYYDGVQVGQITSGITSSPMYLILNNSVDPTYGGPTLVPADLQVDYVRVWQ